MSCARALVATLVSVLFASIGRAALLPQDEARAALARASELVEQGDYESAFELLRSVDVEAAGSLQQYVQVRLGECERLLGRQVAALDTLDRAEAVLVPKRKQYAKVLRCYLLAVRTQTYLDLGLIDVAARDAELAHEMLSQLEASEDPPSADSERIQVDLARVMVAASRNDSLELEHLVDEALARPLYAQHPASAAQLLMRLGTGLKEAARMDPSVAGRARAALEQSLTALSNVERIEPEIALAELDLREGRFAECERRLARAKEQLAAGGAPERLPQYRVWLALDARLAFERDDRVATREELDRQRASLARALDAGLEEWMGRAPRPGGYGFLLMTQERSLLSEWIRLELALSGEEVGARNALERVARAGDACTLARRSGAEGALLDRSLQEVLGPAGEHVLLAYLPAPDRSHLFVADRDRVQHVPLAHSDGIQEARLAVARALERVQGGEASANALRSWQAALRRLADLLLPEPARAAMATRERVTILGRDLLGDVPFEALPLDSGASFGCARAVSHLPSLAVGRLLVARAEREARPRASDEGVIALVLAAPEASELPLDADAARDLLDAWPSAARRVAWGRSATERALREGTSGALLLELFTHGARDPALERSMAFVLDDGEGGEFRLGADQVETLDAPPFVALAVCRSGSGPKRWGDASAAELASSFFLAGTRTRCVVASAFDLDVEATRRLVRGLQAGLVAGLAPDEALRAARVELASDERFADPRYHGLLSALGAARIPLVRP